MYIYNPQFAAQIAIPGNKGHLLPQKPGPGWMCCQLKVYAKAVGWTDRLS